MLALLADIAVIVLPLPPFDAEPEIGAERVRDADLGGVPADPTVISCGEDHLQLWTNVRRKHHFMH